MSGAPAPEAPRDIPPTRKEKPGGTDDDPASYLATGSGLRYKVLHEGRDGPGPDEAAKVKVNYKGMLEDGTIFDSTDKYGAPVEFTLGLALPWWGEGVPLMTAGSRYKFIVPPHLAYGEEGAPPHVPPNATLVFEVELVEFEAGPALPVLHERNPEARRETGSGLVYEILKPGAGEPARDGDVVEVRFAFWDEKGRLIDCSELRGAHMRFSVGTQKIEIFNAGVRLLRPGARFRFEVPAELAFGEKGRGVLVPPDAGTVWELELVRFVETPEFRMPAGEELTITASGLKYHVVKEGVGQSPEMDQDVTVDYAGWLEDGTLFDNSYRRGQPTTFALGRVIQGWKEGLQLMKEGATFILVIPPELGYGERGSGDRIPPGATLVFYV